MQADVVIVGAGPTGLMLARELCLAGVQPIVLERLPEPSDLPKANGLVGRIVELLDYRGLLEEFGADAPFVGPAPGFWFGGLPFALSASEPSPLHALPIPQRRLEQLLAGRLREFDVDIRRGDELTDLSQNGDGVTLQVNGPAGGYRLRTRYLVGCDGAHSHVRKLAGIDFPGTTTRDSVWRLGQVGLPTARLVPETEELEVPGLGRLQPGFTRTPTGLFSFGSFETGVYNVATIEPAQSSSDDDALITLEELRESVRRVLGGDLPMAQPRRISRIVGNSRLADRYRADRVLLAGDAAHVFFGAGGPGLNAGLLDTVNLAWKLAATIQGWSPTGLLDTYNDERHPVGARTILHTRAQSALLMHRGEEAEALYHLFGELLALEQPAHFIGELLNNSDIRYDMKSLAPEPHPLVGRWVPDLRLTATHGATRVAELMHRARPVLLDLTDGIDLAQIAAGWTDRIEVIVARAEGQAPPATAMLIRPDGYVAWATNSDEADAQSTQGLRHALRTWFGDVHPR